jgi:FlaA1/EpsC-like NDP-sugar epimerase
VSVDYTGLRAGEKLHEVLLGSDETDCRPAHPLISHVAVPPLTPSVARDLDPSASPERIVAQLRNLCGNASQSFVHAERRSERVEDLR